MDGEVGGGGVEVEKDIVVVEMKVGRERLRMRWWGWSGKRGRRIICFFDWKEGWYRVFGGCEWR